MFDQLWCRISFRSMRYQGEFTAPGGKILIWPGILGGMNWGGVSIDERARRLFINSISAGMVVQTIPRA
ncbi:MAG TPA: hypothetical protein VNX29_00960 [Kaistia sp.]|nr:hypothetical protein [Kaistia sp.]